MKKLTVATIMAITYSGMAMSQDSATGVVNLFAYCIAVNVSTANALNGVIEAQACSRNAQLMGLSAKDSYACSANFLAEAFVKMSGATFTPDGKMTFKETMPRAEAEKIRKAFAKAAEAEYKKGVSSAKLAIADVNSKEGLKNGMLCTALKENVLALIKKE